MRITNYHIWSIVFSVFFLALLAAAIIVLEEVAHTPFSELTWFEYLLLALATWRFTRLFGRDHITSFLREQFYDIKESKNEVVLVEPSRGPRRVIVDLFACPWCLSLWSAFVVSFFYLLHEIFFYPVLILALSAVAAAVQILMEQRGSKD